MKLIKLLMLALLAGGSKILRDKGEIMPPIGEKLLTRLDVALSEEEQRMLDEIRAKRQVVYNTMHSILPFTKPRFFFSARIKSGVAEYNIEGEPQYKKMSAWLERYTGNGRVYLKTQSFEEINGVVNREGNITTRVIARDGDITYDSGYLPSYYERRYPLVQQLDAVYCVLDTLTLIADVENPSDLAG